MKYEIMLWIYLEYNPVRGTRRDTVDILTSLCHRPRPYSSWNKADKWTHPRLSHNLLTDIMYNLFWLDLNFNVQVVMIHYIAWRHFQFKKERKWQIVDSNTTLLRGVICFHVHFFFHLPKISTSHNSTIAYVE